MRTKKRLLKGGKEYKCKSEISMSNNSRNTSDSTYGHTSGNNSKSSSNILGNTSFQPNQMPNLGKLISNNNALKASQNAIISASTDHERNEAVQQALPYVNITSLKKSMPQNIASLTQGAMKGKDMGSLTQNAMSKAQSAMSNPAVQQQIMNKAGPMVAKLAPFAGMAGKAAKAMGVPAEHVNMAQKMVNQAASKGGNKKKYRKKTYKKKTNRKKKQSYLKRKY